MARKRSRNNNRGEEDRWVGARRVPLCSGNNNNNNNNEPITASVSASASASASTTTDADTDTDTTPGILLELVGLESPTGTVFARIVVPHLGSEPEQSEGKSPNHRARMRGVPVEDLVDRIVGELRSEEAPRRKVDGDGGHPQAIVSVASAETLIELGAVWVLDPASVDRPQNRPVWRRLLVPNEGNNNNNNNNSNGNNGNNNGIRSSILCFDRTMTLRVHSRPSRYSAAHEFRRALEQGKNTHTNSDYGIVLEHGIGNSDSSPVNKTAFSFAFAVLNKPTGLPSHPTVDNAVENLLYQYQRHRQLAYASLPQRLDTETSGLILVAANPQTASHYAKLLERKTTDALALALPLPLDRPAAAADARVDANANANANASPIASSPIQKRYSCLVSFASREAFDFVRTEYLETGKLVEHLVDVDSKAPKSFVERTEGDGNGDGDAAPESTPSTTETETTQQPSNRHRWRLCRLRIRGMTQPMIPPRHQLPCVEGEQPCLCSELEIELLTGRTHQIRGQLSALGCPIVGDPLYGNEDGNVSGDGEKGFAPSRMALQCSRLAFPVEGATEPIDLRLDAAWWSGAKRSDAMHRRKRRQPPCDATQRNATQRDIEG